MKKRCILKVVLVIGCMMIPVLASAQTYVWQSLTSEDAIRIVRAFEGDPVLGVAVTATPLPSAVGRDRYFVLSSGRYGYRVLQGTPDLLIRNDELYAHKDQFYGQTYDPAVLQTQTMTPDAAEAIARGFMEAHYPAPGILTGFKVSNVRSMDGQWTEGYRFVFYQQCAPGVDGPSLCRVEVDSVKGQVVHYTSAYFPVLASPVPALTGQQAMAAAMNAMNISNGQPGEIQGLRITSPDDLGAEQLIYMLTFIGIGPVSNWTTTSEYLVNVDANTGAVLDWDIFMRAGDPDKQAKQPHSSTIGSLRARLAKRLPKRQPLDFTLAGHKSQLGYPPLLIGNQPYMYAGYLCYGLSGAKLLHQGSQQLLVMGNGRHLSLDPRTSVYRLNGKAKRSAGRPVIMAGRYYVPLDVLSAVLPFRIRYNASLKQVDFEPSPSDRSRLLPTGKDVEHPLPH